jgi:Mevalonate pyrophosphate decarboxylase
VTTFIPADYADTVEPMQAAHQAILAALDRYGIAFEPYPQDLPQGNPRGKAAARAHPMQGALKYHGMTDWDWRIAYLPSISVSNDAGYTLTSVAFDPDLNEDQVTIGGKQATGRDLERVVQSLNVVRRIARIESRARVVSHNRVRAETTGKGLGTSASASAALALAAVAAAFGPEIAANKRFVSSLSRLLAGSGCRSATGGLSLWLSYPGIAHEDSFAVRLDKPGQFDELSLITVPISSRIQLKTEEAHRDAPESSLFRSWMLSRVNEVIELIDAIQQGDWQAVGRWSELDSIRLHGVTMSGSMENKIFGWEPENITLFRMCNELRSANIPVYCSTDTGPTCVFLTHRSHSAAVIDAIKQQNLGLDIIEGRIAGPAHLVDLDEAARELGTA